MARGLVQVHRFKFVFNKNVSVQVQFIFVLSKKKVFKSRALSPSGIYRLKIKFLYFLDVNNFLTATRQRFGALTSYRWQRKPNSEPYD